MRQFLFPVIALGLTVSAGAARTTEKPFDVLLRGGTILDGTGRPGAVADLAIKSDRIARIATNLNPDDAVRTMDVTSLVVAPGFIDLHAHASVRIPDYPLAENFLRQGITSIAASNHAEDMPWPLDLAIAKFSAAPNVAYFAGHTFIRKRAMGLQNRKATREELAAMEAMTDAAMLQGALGLSTGLEYVPANYAPTDEIVTLARVAARHGGVYVTHMRDEGAGLIRSVEETIRIARDAGLPAHINHHKAAGAAQFGWTKETLALLEKARAEGLDVTSDVYPYTAFSTRSDTLFPAWALEDGPEAVVRRLNDPATRARIESEMRALFPQQAGAGPASVQFRELPADRRFDGGTLEDWLRAHKQPVTIEAGVRAIVELQKLGGFVGIFHAMDEGDLERLLRDPQTMIETDGDLVGYGVGFPHPRSYGSFPRVLARYVRERKTLTLEQAVQKMTSLPARRLHLTERGILREGLLADITVFDAARIEDRATYADPHRYSTGVIHVFVNGEPVMLAGALTGLRPGRVLQSAARPKTAADGRAFRAPAPVPPPVKAQRLPRA